MIKQLPPPMVLACTRVLSYVFIPETIPYVARTTLYVDGMAIGRVPRLAIGENLSEGNLLHLFHCDDHWNVLGASGAQTLDETKALAERDFPGIDAHWVDLNTSVQAALAYYDADTDGPRCSFCRKRAFDMLSGWRNGENAAICRECVERYYLAFQESALD